MPQATLTVPIDRLTIHAPLLGFRFVVEDAQADRDYDATLIRPGVFVPGMGNGFGKRIRFSREFIERKAPTMEGKKVDLEHSQHLLDEVGFVHQVGSVEGRLRGRIRLQATRPKFPEAVGFVEGRLQAKRVPEVSVEVEAPKFRDATEDEKAEFDLDIIDGDFAGVALVSQGACTAAAGCGIGLTSAGGLVLHTILAATIPPVRSPSFSESPWEAPGLQDFTDEAWEALEDAAKSRIAAHYLATRTSNPPAAFADLVYPYREPDGGAVNVNALRAILGARGQAADLPADVKTRAQGAARGLLDAFNEREGMAGAALAENPSDLSSGEGVSADEDALMVDTPAPNAAANPNPAAPSQLAALTQRVAELEGCKASMTTELAKRDQEIAALRASVQRFEAAELKALRDAVEAVAPKDKDGKTIDLKGILGDPPTRETLQIVLRAWQSQGAKVGLGRHTEPGNRDAPTAPTANAPGADTGDPAANQTILGFRSRLGLDDKTAKRLPRGMQKHSRELLGPHGGVA